MRGPASRRWSQAIRSRLVGLAAPAGKLAGDAGAPRCDAGRSIARARTGSGLAQAHGGRRWLLRRRPRATGSDSLSSLELIGDEVVERRSFRRGWPWRSRKRPPGNSTTCGCGCSTSRVAMSLPTPTCCSPKPWQLLVDQWGSAGAVAPNLDHGPGRGPAQHHGRASCSKAYQADQRIPGRPGRHARDRPELRGSGATASALRRQAALGGSLLRPTSAPTRRGGGGSSGSRRSRRLRRATGELRRRPRIGVGQGGGASGSGYWPVAAAVLATGGSPLLLARQRAQGVLARGSSASVAAAHRRRHRDDFQPAAGARRGCGRPACSGSSSGC